jgi:branched-subunit amino acid transport protein AzlD
MCFGMCHSIYRYCLTMHSLVRCTLLSIMAGTLLYCCPANSTTH